MLECKSDTWVYNCCSIGGNYDLTMLLVSSVVRFMHFVVNVMKMGWELLLSVRLAGCITRVESPGGGGIIIAGVPKCCFLNDIMHSLCLP